MQLCSKPRGSTRNRAQDLPKKGSAFITSSDHVLSLRQQNYDVSTTQLLVEAMGLHWWRATPILVCDLSVVSQLFGGPAALCNRPSTQNIPTWNQTIHSSMGGMPRTSLLTCSITTHNMSQVHFGLPAPLLQAAHPLLQLVLPLDMPP